MRRLAFGFVVLLFIVTACSGGGPSTPPPTFLLQWGLSGTGEGQFDGPRGLAVDPQGNVYVADINNSRIQKFAADGAFLAQWEQSGSGEGQFAFPAGVAVGGQGERLRG